MFIFDGVGFILSIILACCLIGMAFVPFASQIFALIVILGGLVFYFILGSASGWLGKIFFPVLKISFIKANYALIEFIYKLWDII